jgi:hypothetical protein
VNRVAWIVIAISIFVLSLIGWKLSIQLSEAESGLALGQLTVFAIEAQERVEIAEHIRSGNLESALNLLESRIFMDGDTLADILPTSDDENRKYVTAALNRIESYEEKYPWQP